MATPLRELTRRSASRNAENVPRCSGNACALGYKRTRTLHLFSSQDRFRLCQPGGQDLRQTDGTRKPRFAGVQGRDIEACSSFHWEGKMHCRHRDRGLPLDRTRHRQGTPRSGTSSYPSLFGRHYLAIRQCSAILSQNRSIQTLTWDKPDDISSSDTLTEGHKPRDIMKELRKWQEEYESEQRRLRIAEAHAFKDSDDFVGNSFRKYFAAPPFSPHGDLPRNFMGNKKSRIRALEFPRIGDLRVELKEKFPTCSVLVRRLDNRGDLYYDNNGLCSDQPRKNSSAIHFSDFLNPEDIIPLLPHLPSSSREFQPDETGAYTVPGEVGMYLRQQLSRVQRDIQDAYYTHFERIHSAWDLVAWDNQTRQLSLEELSSIIFECSQEKVTVPQMAALFCYEAAQHGPLQEIQIDRTKAWSSKYNIAVAVVSRQDRALIKKVLQWTREYRAAPNKARQASSIIGAFARWAAEVIQKSRLHRLPLPDGTLGPFGKLPVTSAFQDLLIPKSTIRNPNSISLSPRRAEDVEILRYLKLYDGRMPRNRIASEEADQNIIPIIIQATGMYQTSEITHQLINVFIRELGLVTPWVSTAQVIDPDFNGSDAADRPGKEVETASATTNGLADNLGKLRHNWGDMDVFCIDASSTMLLDDGVSLEAIPGKSEQFWIHVHVSNPTAFLEPDHQIAQIAEEVVTATYAPGYMRKMLPDADLESWSLRAGSPVLTFSARVNRAGELLETTIRPGCIRKMTRVTPEAVDQVINAGIASEPLVTRFMVGDGSAIKLATSASTDVGNQLSHDQKVQIRLMNEIVSAIRSRWNRLGGIDVSSRLYSRASLSVHGIDSHVPSEKEPYHFTSDPTIILEKQIKSHNHASSRTSNANGSQMVADLMMLAGHIAGSYCATRNIPVPYQETIEDPSIYDPNLYFQDFVEKLPADRPLLQDLAIRPWLRYQGNSTRTMTPVQHRITGMSAVTQATSPLRRYSDMLVHWQIGCALKLESQSGRLPQRFKYNDPRLTFSHDRVAGLLPHLDRLFRHWKRRSNMAGQMWFHQLVLRALIFGEDPSFPRQIEVLVHNRLAGNSSVSVFSPMLGLNLNLRDRTEGEGPAVHFRPGEWWLAEFDLSSSSRLDQLKPICRLGRECADRYRGDGEE